MELLRYCSCQALSVTKQRYKNNTIKLHQSGATVANVANVCEVVYTTSLMLYGKGSKMDSDFV